MDSSYVQKNKHDIAHSFFTNSLKNVINKKKLLGGYIAIMLTLLCLYTEIQCIYSVYVKIQYDKNG